MEENQSSSPLKHHGTPLLRILALLAFALLIAVVSTLTTYYFLDREYQLQLQNYQQFQPVETSYPTEAPKVNPSQTGLITTNISYSHPKLRYTLEYPKSWNGGTKKITEGLNQKYEDFETKSSDYKLSTEGIEHLVKGASFFIRAENTIEDKIEEQFNKDSLLVEIATNKKNVTVDGQNAIQFDYGYESQTATVTIFIKNKIYYFIKFVYPNASEKNNYWDEYLELLKSFKAR